MQNIPKSIMYHYVVSVLIFACHICISIKWFLCGPVYVSFWSCSLCVLVVFAQLIHFYLFNAHLKCTIKRMRCCMSLTLWFAISFLLFCLTDYYILVEVCFSDMLLIFSIYFVSFFSFVMLLNLFRLNQVAFIYNIRYVYAPNIWLYKHYFLFSPSSSSSYY